MSYVHYVCSLFLSLQAEAHAKRQSVEEEIAQKTRRVMMLRGFSSSKRALQLYWLLMLDKNDILYKYAASWLLHTVFVRR
jgi:hypothetical protein